MLLTPSLDLLNIVSKICVKMLKMCFTVLKVKQKWELWWKYWITERHGHGDRVAW